MNRLTTPCVRAGQLLAALALLVSVHECPATDSLPSLDLKVAFPELKFERELWMEEAPDGSKRFAVVQQGGKVFLLPPSGKADFS